MGVGSTGGTAGIVSGYYLVDGGREVDQKVVFEVPGGTSKVCLVGLGEQHSAVNKSEEVGADASEGLDDAGDDRFPLGGGVTGKLVFFSRIRRKAGSRKGSRGIP